MNTRMNGHEFDVVQLRRASAPANDQLDTAGQTILQMIDRAAGVAEEHSRHALEMAQKLSYDLGAAEDRVAELEAELASYRERADRAEQWLHRVYSGDRGAVSSAERRSAGRAAKAAKRKASIGFALIRNRKRCGDPR